MAVHIIDVLKIIYIQHEHRTGDLLLNGLGQILHELAAVVNTCQEIMLGGRFQNRPCPLQFREQFPAMQIIIDHNPQNHHHGNSEYRHG